MVTWQGRANQASRPEMAAVLATFEQLDYWGSRVQNAFSPPLARSWPEMMQSSRG